MSEARAGALDAALALLIRIVGAGLIFGLQVLLARLMPADGYGGFVTLWTWMLALGSFAALGFAESSLRFLPRYQLRGRHAQLRNYWRFGFAIVLATSGSAALVAALLALGVAAVNGPGLMLLLVALGLPFLAMEYYLEGVARSFGWFRLAAVPVYIIRPVLIGGTALALSAGGVVLDLPVIGAILIGAMAAVTSGLALTISWRMRGMVANGRRSASPRQRRLWLMASLPLLVLSGLEDLTNYADVLLLSLLAEPEAVGVYFAAARSLALAGFVAYAMTLVAGRRFALDLAGRSRAQLQQSILESSRLTFWATLVAVAVTLAIGPLLLSAFGPDYANGQSVLVILGLGMVVRSLAGQAGEVLIVAGRQREGVAIGLGVLLVMVALGLVLVPAMGMQGAAIASAVAMAVRTVGLVTVLKRMENLHVLSLRPPTLRAGVAPYAAK